MLSCTDARIVALDIWRIDVEVAKPQGVAEQRMKERVIRVLGELIDQARGRMQS